MPGKLSHLKSTLERVTEEPSRQEELNKVKVQWRDKSIGEISEEFRRIYDAKEKLKDQLYNVQIELDAMEQLVVDHLTAVQLEQIRTTDGSTTLYIKDDVYCKQVNRAEYLAWIEETGRKDLLSVHPNTMAAMTIERLEKGQPLPPGITAQFNPKIRIRRNTK